MASSKGRRLDSYQRDCLRELGFEASLVHARQGLVLELLERHRPRVVVEVGCGADILARGASDMGLLPDRWVVVEPGATFAALARDAQRAVPGLSVVEEFLEDSVSEALAITRGPADMVLLSGLLHEIENPRTLLDAAGQVLADSGLLSTCSSRTRTHCTGGWPGRCN